MTFRFTRTCCQPYQVWFRADFPAAKTVRVAAFRSMRHGAALPNSGLLRPAFEPGAYDAPAETNARTISCACAL